MISKLCLHEFGEDLVVNMLPAVEERRMYDFHDPDNVKKWRGKLIDSLEKVFKSVHPSLECSEEALYHMETLCWRLLGQLCAPPLPVSTQELDERVARILPLPPDRLSRLESRDRRTLRPKDHKEQPLHSLIQDELFLRQRLEPALLTHLMAVIELVSQDVFRLAGDFVSNMSHKSGCLTIMCGDINTAMYADKVLMNMFNHEEQRVKQNTKTGDRRSSLSYAELVRDLLSDEKSFLRDLHLIIRVFKDELEKILHDDPQKITLIFGNIVDIYELTVTLLGNLEDACEMAQDSPTPYIGSCFEELAEVEEFRAYVRYANNVMSSQSRDTLQSIVNEPTVSERLETAGHGFRLAVKYYLPKLLLTPVAHMFMYYKYVDALMYIAPANEDRESFKQVQCNLQPIINSLLHVLATGPEMQWDVGKASLHRLLECMCEHNGIQCEATLCMAARTKRRLAQLKCAELANLIENWDARDAALMGNDFLREDTICKLGPGRRVAERKAFLFDGLLLLCKPVTGLAVLTVNSSGSSSGPLKLKEKLQVRKMDVVDRPDTDEVKNCIELVGRCNTGVMFSCASCVEKWHWMCDLVMLNTKPMLDRTLDSILQDLERRHPLKLPPPSLYRFAVPDSPDNIVLEPRPGLAPCIRGATLLKLVERLTYHVHADLVLVRTFLTTYRNFCKPAELLSLLIERFDIPDPSLVYDAPAPGPAPARIRTPKKEIPVAKMLDAMSIGESIESVVSSDAEKLSKNTTREDWKRYRKEFQQPVRFRVINVLRHWVDQHFYDFERDPVLLDKLRSFLESVDGRPMRKWVQSVLKTVARKAAESEAAGAAAGVAHVFDQAPPPVIRHLHDPEKYNWHPLTFHPLELARQLTLFEFHLYKQVKPSELVDAVWTKEDKEITSPNLLRMAKHTTNVTRWMEKWVVESRNTEERAAVLARLVEVTVALRELNNFNGVLALLAVVNSAAVHRLQARKSLPARLGNAVDTLCELHHDHLKLYREQLRSINPPCVPFLGNYLTNIMHIETGNKDFLTDPGLINFSKRRMVAEITGEIQQYQNQPYCLTVEPRTRAFLESLDPFPGMSEKDITDYLYDRSMEIEPKSSQKLMPKYARQYPELSLKFKFRLRQDQHSYNSDDSSNVQLSPPGAWDGCSVSSLSIYSEDRGSRQDVSRTNLKSKRHSNASTLSRYKSGGSAATSPRELCASAADLLADTLCRSSTSPGDTRGSQTLHITRTSVSDQESAPPPPPPLLPRGGAPAPTPHERAPHLPPRSDATAWSVSPQPHHENMFKLPGTSPKRSPAPALPPALPPAPPSAPPPPALTPLQPLPPAPPLPPPPTLPPAPSLPPAATPSPAPAAADRNSFSFAFPPRAPHTPAPSPPAPHPGTSEVSTPPPLPPRRRRDSAAPPTPKPVQVPPPLPPRPAPAPELLRPRDSAILQRRHHSSSTAPRLPPKPPPPAPAVSPRT